MPSKKKKNSSETIKKSKKESKATKLKEQINSQKNDLEDQRDKYLRLKAEFDNYRRRKEKELIDFLKYDGELVIKQFLSVLDDLDRLAKASEKNGSNNNEKIKEGIELEVISFTKPGDIVNPELHDALMMRTEDGKDENEILEVFEKGYCYKDRVIRHAKVVVNQTPS